MSDLTSHAPAFKDAFFALHSVVHEDDAVQVSFGHPGQREADEIVAYLDLTSELVPATISTRRQFEETITLTVVASVWIGGASDSEKAASDRAYELLAEAEYIARVTDTTIGGTVRECYMTSHTSTGQTPPEFLSQGRLIEVSAVFTAHSRVSS